MDRRVALETGSKITFPGMDCVIEGIVGKGSNAIVYQGRYRDCNNRDLFHRVIIKELFPYHPKNMVYRSDDGNIVTEKEAQSFFELQKTSFDYGNSVHLRMLEMYPDRIGGNINTFSVNGTLYSIIGFDGGSALDKEYRLGVKSLGETVRLMKQILDALEIFHKSGYLHLDISPDNILITGSGENQRITLIDYNSVHKLEELREGASLYCSAKEGYTSPEIINMNMACVSEATDIYSVTAVFYWLLTGKSLTPFQRLCKRAPDVKDSPLLIGVPDTVLWQVNAILRKGLSTLAEKRYRSCSLMSDAINELINRIEAVGITHSSIWDAGRKMIKGMIKENPSFRYLAQPDKLYPLRVTSEKGESFTIEELSQKCLENNSAVLMGNGGMGKTTALLHTAVTRNSRYSPVEPATVYISLFDYNGSGDNYIKNSILELLRFEKGVSGMEDARHRLIREFNSTVKTAGGERPAYLLLIDGFNEASGNTEGLMGEIIELSRLRGVRLIVSTRSAIDTPDFDVYKMAPLEQTDIRKKLEEEGLLYPEAPEIRELISIPLMLSVFCNAALDSERQLSCKTVNELLQEYITGLCRKEIRNLEDDSPQKWSVESAVRLVLPYICAELSKKKHLLSEKELLRVVSVCYRLISKGRIATLFPEWIGHSKDIKNGCSSAEEWYSVVVGRILWRKMGLLVKEQGGYRIMHQRIQEFMAEPYKKISKKVRIHNGISALAVFAVTGMVLAVWALFIRPDAYDSDLTRSYFGGIVDSVSQTGREIELMYDLLAADEGNGQYNAELESLNSMLEHHRNMIANGFSGSYIMAQSIYEKMRETGDVVPWSMKKIDEDSVQKLFSLGEEACASYGLYADILTYLRHNEEAEKKYGDIFRQKLREKLDADAALSDALYFTVASPHMESLTEKDTVTYSYYMETLSDYGDLSSSEPENPDSSQIGRLEKESREKGSELESLEIFTVYRRENQ